MAVIGALRGRRAGDPDQPQVRLQRARAHRLPTPSPRRIAVAPGSEVPEAFAGQPCGGDRPRRRPPVRWRRPPGPRRREPCPHRLHLGHHRAAQGRGPAPPLDRLQPRRAGRGVGLDRARRRRPRAAAVSRARPGDRDPRPGAPRRRRRCTSGASPPEGVQAALEGTGTMLFGVPTMYRRLADAAAESPELARGAGRRAAARVRVRGAAGLRACPHEELTGRGVVERYGMTETLMNTAIHADARPAPGTVGPPLPGVEVRLVDDDGAVLEGADDETIGEIQVRGPNLFLGVPQPPRRHRRGDARRLVCHRRHGHPHRRGLHPHRRAPRHRPHQERRLQDRRRGDRGLPARAPGRRGRRRHRRGRRRPGRARRRLDRPARRRDACRSQSWSTTWPSSSPPTSARATCASSTSCPATTWARSRRRGSAPS